MSLALTLPLCLFALLLEALAGYPLWLYRAIGHPVTWMGAGLSWLEARLNRSADRAFVRRLFGLLTLLLLLGGTALVTLPLDLILWRNAFSFGLLIILAASLPAQRSLEAHVAAVATALESGSLDASRVAVGQIVGRNTAVLDAAGIARAAIESLAENFSDGIVAPAFWIACCGLTGGALYKAVNTADSMIGHRTARYAAFGWAAARVDDGVNLPASRLAALLLLLAAPLAGGSVAGAWRCLRRDARGHRSPNAGWPEAAMAGALGLQLAGPRVYGTVLVEDAFMGDGRRVATSADIRQALRLYRMACALQIGGLALLTLALRLHA